MFSVGRLPFSVLERGSIPPFISPTKIFFVYTEILVKDLFSQKLCHCVASSLFSVVLKLCCQTALLCLFLSRLINQRLMEEQSQVEELQKNLQEQGSKADDVSDLHCVCMNDEQLNEMLTTTTESQNPIRPHLVTKDGPQDCSAPLLLEDKGFDILKTKTVLHAVMISFFF